ncbi:hypothetical protein ABE142_16120 [Paenibacillus alvei]|uniref:hypothetical protein n=1 Tax=Paenibacillus alvei TaxID=44250 RepID=UPI003D27872E
MFKMKKMLVTMLVMCLLATSFSALASAAPDPKKETVDYGYGVKAHNTYIYFDSKYDAYKFIDGASLPSYYAYKDFLVGLGISIGNGAASIIYGVFSAMTQAGYAAMLERAKADIDNVTGEQVSVKVTKWENPRGGGLEYTYTYSVGAWMPGALPWSSKPPELS